MHMNIVHIPEEIRSEFSVNEAGQAFATQSGIARLCGVSKQSISLLIKEVALVHLRASSKIESEALKPLMGIDLSASSKIADTEIVHFIFHYAMYAKKTTEQAKKLCLAFAAIGIRAWIQQEIGWQPQQQLPESKEKLEFSRSVAKALEKISARLALTENATPVSLESMILKAVQDNEDFWRDRIEGTAIERAKINLLIKDYCGLKGLDVSEAWGIINAAMLHFHDYDCWENDNAGVFGASDLMNEHLDKVSGICEDLFVESRDCHISTVGKQLRISVPAKKKCKSSTNY